MAARPDPRARYTFFATCAPGVEPVLHAEVKELRLGKIEQQVGGVRFDGALRDAWRANLHLRTAIRVLLRVARFAAEDGEALYRGAREVDWSAFLTSRSTFLVSAQASRSRLDHTLFVEQRVKDAIADHFRESEGARPSVDRESPDVRVHAHLHSDRCTLSIDTSGESLHKRGWRRYQGRAPLAETTAAAMVLLSGWDRRSPLIDPFCGSGTILIEAALIASGTPPGAYRERFGFERLPGHDARAWEAMREEARKPRDLPPKLVLRGIDLDPSAIDGARRNAEAAGLGGRIDLAAGEAGSLELKPGWNAWIVTNPPYGERVGSERQLRSLYRRFGELLRARAGGCRLALLSGNPRLVRELGLEPRRATRMYNGSIECELIELEVPR